MIYPQPSRPNWYRFIVHQFHQPARDFSAIEYKLRRASSQLELYGSSSVREMRCPDEALKIPLGWVAKGGKRKLDHWCPADPHGLHLTGLCKIRLASNCQRACFQNTAMAISAIFSFIERSLQFRSLFSTHLTSGSPRQPQQGELSLSEISYSSILNQPLHDCSAAIWRSNFPSNHHEVTHEIYDHAEASS